MVSTKYGYLIAILHTMDTSANTPRKRIKKVSNDTDILPTPSEEELKRSTRMYLRVQELGSHIV